MFIYLKKRKNKRQGFPLKLCNLVSQMPFYCFFFCFFSFFSNLNFKLKRLRCKDSLKNAFDAQAFKEKKRQRKKEMCKLNYYYLRAWNKLQLPQMESLLTPLPSGTFLGLRSQTLSYTSTFDRGGRNLSKAVFMNTYC